MTSSTVRQPCQYLNLILSSAIRTGVTGLAKTLAADLGRDGVRANTVQPGRIETERIRQLDADSAKRRGVSADVVRDEFLQAIPLGDVVEYADDRGHDSRFISYRAGRHQQLRALLARANDQQIVLAVGFAGAEGVRQGYLIVWVGLSVDAAERHAVAHYRPVGVARR